MSLQGAGRASVLAHRGASIEAPENTLSAFERAIQIGVDFIELDLHMTRDGSIVAIHDDSVDRTTDGRGLVHEMTLDQMKRLDAGSWFNRAYPSRARPEYAGERIPTLEEVFDLVRGHDVGLYIEIKKGPFYPRGFEERLVSVIKKHKMQRRVVVQSFDHASVKRVRELDPSIKTAILLDCKPIDPWLDARAAGADQVAPRWIYATSDLIKAAKRKRLKVMVWTVDDPDVMREMIRRGVDGIATNDPSLLKRVLADTR